MVLQSFLCLPIIFLCCKSQSIIFEQGVFEIETLSIPGLTTDSATVLTLSGPSITQTRLVPVWHCTTSCSNNNYGIIVTPPAATGHPGNVYPPPGYVALGIGRNGLPTPLASTTFGSLPGETISYVNASSPQSASSSSGRSPRTNLSAIKTGTVTSNAAASNGATSNHGQDGNSQHSSGSEIGSSSREGTVISINTMNGSASYDRATSLSTGTANLLITTNSGRLTGFTDAQNIESEGPSRIVGQANTDTESPPSATTSFSSVIKSNASSGECITSVSSVIGIAGVAVSQLPSPCLPKTTPLHDSLRQIAPSAPTETSVQTTSASRAGLGGPPGVVIPLLTQPATLANLDPSGARASNSASTLQIACVYATRKIDTWIEEPEDSSLLKYAEDEIQRTKDYAQHFQHELGDDLTGDGSTGCSGLSLLNIVQCAIQKLEKLSADIEAGERDMDQIKNDVTDLGNTIPSLIPNEPEPEPGPEPDDDDDDEDENSSSSDTEPSTIQQSSEGRLSTNQGSTTPSASTQSMSHLSKSAIRTRSLASSAASVTPTTTQPPFTSSSIASEARGQYIIFASSQGADVNALAGLISTVAPVPSKTTLRSVSGVVTWWLIPKKASDAAIAGLTPNDVNEIQKQAGVDTVITNQIYATNTVSSTEGQMLTSGPAPSTISLMLETPVSAGIQPSGNAGAKRGLNEPMNSTLRVEPRVQDLEKRMALPWPIDAQERANPPRWDGLDVPYELRAISQPVPPAGQPLVDFSELDYVMRTESGEGTWVYVIDSGLWTSHDDFQYGCTIVAIDEWLLIGDGVNETYAASDPVQHGTAVASKVCGRIAGVAKDTTIIPVVWLIEDDESVVALWTDVLFDIQDRREESNTVLPGKTVINFSAGIGTRSIPDNGIIHNTTQKIMQMIMDLGVPIVVSGGNEGTDIIRAPARWADETFKIIVASSVDRNFEQSSWSNAGKQITIWGIGSQNVIARGSEPWEYEVNGEGTSYVAPQVAGLIAYFLSIPNLGLFSTANPGTIDLVNEIWTCFKTGPCAYPRGPSGLRVLYNQLDGTYANRCTSPAKRDLSAGGVCTVRQPGPQTSTGIVADSSSNNPTDIYTSSRSAVSSSSLWTSTGSGAGGFGNIANANTNPASTTRASSLRTSILAISNPTITWTSSATTPPDPSHALETPIAGNIRQALLSAENMGPAATISSGGLICSAVGVATYEPPKWCECNTNSGTLYPTISAARIEFILDNFCAWKTLPSSTVHPTPVAPNTTSLSPPSQIPVPSVPVPSTPAPSKPPDRGVAIYLEQNGNSEGMLTNFWLIYSYTPGHLPSCSSKEANATMVDPTIPLQDVPGDLPTAMVIEAFSATYTILAAVVMNTATAAELQQDAKMVADCTVLPTSEPSLGCGGNVEMQPRATCEWAG